MGINTLSGKQLYQNWFASILKRDLFKSKEFDPIWGKFLPLEKIFFQKELDVQQKKTTTGNHKVVSLENMARNVPSVSVPLKLIG